jgi:chromosome segregation ATPase
MEENRSQADNADRGNEAAGGARYKARITRDIRHKINDEINAIEREITEARWKDRFLQRRISEIRIRREQLNCERTFNRVALEEYRKGLDKAKEDEANLRKEAEDKRKEAERLRGSASQACLIGVSHRSNGNAMKAGPMLHQVERLVLEIEDLDKKTEKIVETIAQYEKWTRILSRHIKDVEEKSKWNLQEIDECSTELQDIRASLEKLIAESVKHSMLLSKVREGDQDVRSFADIFDGRVATAELASEMTRESAEEMVRSLSLMNLGDLPAEDEPEPQTDEGK